MNLCRSLLLGSAASLVAAAGAQAADLPSRKAAPVEYVKICDVYGAGFFYIPGTDTCIKLGGYVRAEYQYTPGRNVINEGDTVSGPKSDPVTGAVTAGGKITATGGSISQIGSAQDQTGMEMRGRIDLDARTRTQWGTVQTVIQLRAANTDGIRNIGGTTAFGTAYTPVGNGSSGLTMERGFIRFDGITAGVAPENFTVGPGMYFGVPWGKFSNGIKQLSYTATFAGGLSATLSLESRGDYPYNTVSGATPAPSATPVATNSTYVNQWNTGYNLVGNLRYDGGWGFVQVAGAVGNNSTSTTPSASYSPLLGPQTLGAYAFGGTVQIKLPMLAPGDQIYFIGTYAHGMNGLIMTGGVSSISDGDSKRFLGGVLRTDSNIYPIAVTATGTPTAFGTENAWQIGTLFTHYWAPQWRSNFAAGYVHLAPPTVASNPVAAGCTAVAVGGAEPAACAGLNTQFGKADIWDAQGNIIWSPTKNFDIGLEIAYARIKQVIQDPAPNFVAAGLPGLDQDNWGAKLRIERTF